MAKLYPPLIEGSIPAFCTENGVVKITIPFSMNRAVSKGLVSGLAVKVKTVLSSTYLYTATITSSLYYNLDADIPYVTVMLSGNTDEERKFISKLRQGLFYKFQIAYIDLNGEVGYYSTVGVAKYTTEPSKMEIIGMKDNINLVLYEYTGVYSQEGRDTTERVYSYQFDVYDKNNNLFTTSGPLLHNSSKDTDTYESYDTFELSRELVYDERYFILYTVTTINGMTVSTRRYSVMNRSDLIEPEIEASVVATINQEEGYIDINLVGRGDSIATGAFLLTRKVEDDEESVWNKLSTFRLNEESPTRFLFRDFTVEHGKTYYYALQLFSDSGLYSKKVMSRPITIDFEYSYLYDGERLLKIKYNPKMSSFKTDVLETKTDTIGGKYPFIFRNGSVYYREFPISGLLSHLMDDEGLFVSKEELQLEEDTLTQKGRLETSDLTFKHPYNTYKEREKLTNLNENNIAMERRFKLAAMEWLTNGKPKLFRSPTEGNFIIRVMNTSLAPNDTLGRMLHTFNSTAYEIAEFNFENLVKFGFIIIEEKDAEKILQWETVKFAEEELNNGYYAYTNVFHPDESLTRISDIDNLIELPAGTESAENEWNKRWSNEEGRWINEVEHIRDTGMSDYLRAVKYTTYQIGKVNNYPITRVEFYDMEPGSKVKLGLQDGSVTEIMIGMTGRYIVDIEVPIYEVVLESTMTGKMVYSYYAEQPSTFKTISNVTYADIVAEQYIGESAPIHDLLKVPQEDNTLPSYNPKNEITDYYYVRAYRRPIEDIYYEIVNGIRTFYLDIDKRAELTSPDAFVLYRINALKNNTSVAEGYYDFYNDKQYALSEYDPVLTIQPIAQDNTNTNDFITNANNQMISLETLFSFETKSMNDFIGYISCGNGVVLEIGYSMKITEYVVENRPGKYPALASAKNAYQEAVNEYNEYSVGMLKSYAEEAALRTAMKTTYLTYMKELINALIEEEKEDIIYG